jgi:hypothetical protein
MSKRTRPRRQASSQWDSHFWLSASAIADAQHTAISGIKPDRQKSLSH